MADPYVITNCTQLAEMNDSRDANYSLGNDIDCTDTMNWNSGNGWSPISPAYANRFIGSFNGAGYDITGLYMNTTSSYVGFFGYADDPGNISNFDLIGLSFKGGDYVGGVLLRTILVLTSLLYQSRVTLLAVRIWVALLG